MLILIPTSQQAQRTECHFREACWLRWDCLSAIFLYCEFSDSSLTCSFACSFIKKNGLSASWARCWSFGSEQGTPFLSPRDLEPDKGCLRGGLSSALQAPFTLQPSSPLSPSSQFCRRVERRHDHGKDVHVCVRACLFTRWLLGAYKLTTALCVYCYPCLSFLR